MKTKYNQIAKQCILFILLITLSYSNVTAADTVSNSKGVWIIKRRPAGGAAGTRDTMDISFKPDSLTTNCGKIVLAQTLKMTFYDAAGVGTVVENVGLLHKAFKQMADDTVSGGTVVDNIYCEKDPYGNGDDTQDWTGAAGSSSGDGTPTTPSTFFDPPSISDGIFPAGAVKVVIEFEICAYCESGTDLNTCYGCIKWKYERIKGAANSGTVSFVPGVPAGEPSAPSASHTAAVAKFKTNHTDSTGAKFCPEARIDSILNSLSKIFESLKFPSFFRVNHSYRVLYADKGIKKGISVPGMNLPNQSIGDSISPGEYIFIPAGSKLGLTRSDVLPATDPLIPFPASFNDVFYGSTETLERGVVPGILHQGVRVKNCSGLTLCAAAPVNSTNPNGFVLFSTQIDNQLQRVIFKNNAISTHGIMCKNVMSTAGVVTLNPGDSVIYNYPGQLPACASTLNLKLFIQGYTNGATGMAPVLSNQSELNTTGNCDTITVDLHHAAPPFLLAHSTTAVLNQNGTATCNFPAITGPYFVAVRHRNAIETWSSNPINFNQGIANYDFSNASTKAFGANQIQMAPGVWAFYSGDVNQDQNIDLLDFAQIDNDVNNFNFGYYNTDLNGDGNVDLLDISIVEMNVINFIFANTPN